LSYGDKDHVILLFFDKHVSFSLGNFFFIWRWCILHLHLHLSHLADALIQSDLQIGAFSELYSSPSSSSDASSSSKSLLSCSSWTSEKNQIYDLLGTETCTYGFSKERIGGDCNLQHLYSSPLVNNAFNKWLFCLKCCLFCLKLLFCLWTLVMCGVVEGRCCI
jgi:hypothetical protein